MEACPQLGMFGVRRGAGTWVQFYDKLYVNTCVCVYVCVVCVCVCLSVCLYVCIMYARMHVYIKYMYVLICALSMYIQLHVYESMHM